MGALADSDANASSPIGQIYDGLKRSMSRQIDDSLSLALSRETLRTNGIVDILNNN